MNKREKKLAIALAVLGLCGILFLTYSLVWTPLTEAKARSAKLEDELAEKSAKLDKSAANAKKLAILQKQSLPADLALAKREYQAMIDRLLAGAGVPKGYTITSKDPTDASRVPSLDPKLKLPAYNRIGLDIVIKKTDLPTVSRFLASYYRLDLLQQITKLEIKRTGDAEKNAKKDDRSDLEVKLVTEAVIMDGAEKRQALLNVPAAFGAIGGAIGHFAVDSKPDVSRNIVPQQFSQVLATLGRDYAVLAASDPFHGPLPVKATTSPPPIVTAPPPPPPVYKEDISPYVKLTDITRRSDGSATANLFDIANKQDYQIDLTRASEKLEVKVMKYYYIESRRKPLETLTDLVISEDGTSTDRRFKVLGLDIDGQGLVLAEITPEKPAEEPKAKDDGKGSKSGRNNTSTKKSATKVTAKENAVAAVVGAAGTPAPMEKVFCWRVGQTLKSLKPVPAEEVAEFLLKSGMPSSVPVVVKVPPLETAPPPRPEGR